MKKIILFMVIFTSCQQAGILEDNVSASSNASPTMSSLTLDGTIGVGSPLKLATVTIVDVTIDDDPILIETTTTDETGHFSTTLQGISSNQLLHIIATGGSSVDPITFKSVSIASNTLEGIFRIKNINTDKSIQITALTTLASAFYECLVNNESLAANPYDYSISVFHNLFGVNLFTAFDAYLDGGTNDTDENSLYTAYNLGFSKMAKDKKANSSFSIITAFSDELKNSCDLIGPLETVSGSYAFHEESFRKDYLNALQKLSNESAISSLIDANDIEDKIESIRSNSNILFEFKGYSL